MDQKLYDRYPVLIVAICIFEILMIVCKTIYCWGSVPIFSYIGFFMNAYCFVCIINFAVFQYKNPINGKKKPFKTLLKKYCITCGVMLVTLRIDDIWINAAYVASIIIVAFMVGQLLEYEKNVIKIWFVLALLTVAAIYYAYETPLPEGKFGVAVFIVNCFNQVIQFLVIGLTYILRGSRLLSMDLLK